jgi:hypothetical protein
MTLSRLVTLVLVGTLCCNAAAQPTQQDIQQDFDAEKYQDALKKLSTALGMKGNAAQAYDRVALFKLKGESHLRLKQPAPASDSFTNAAKEAKDSKEVGLCNATALLIKRSTNGVYTPKLPQAGADGSRGGKGAPIDIIDPKSRKDAMAALFNDESKQGLAKVESLKKQKTLKPVMEGIRDLATLRALEMAATDSDATTKQALSQLGSHANQLMGDALKTMAAKVDQIARQANETNTQQKTYSDGRVENVTSKRGLTSVDQSALKDVIATCMNIKQACDEFAAALESEGAGFSGTASQSDQLATRADEVLKANYEPEIRGGSGVPRTGTPRGGTPPGATPRQGGRY